MKRRSTFLVFILLLVSYHGLGQKSTDDRSLVDHFGIGVSLNAIADEAIGVVNIYSERSLYDWKRGELYAGLGLYAGAFNDINSKFNQFTRGRILLVRPLDLMLGHKTQLWKDKIAFRTSLSAGVAFVNQKITIEDERYQVNSSYLYTFREFAVHAKAGASFALSNRSNLELYTNLPVVNQRLGLLGIGLAFNKSI